MRVLFLIDTLEAGGSEKSLLQILPCFARTRAIICHIYPGETLKAAYERSGVRVFSLDVPGKYSFGSAANRVRQVVEQERPDLIHTSLFRADVVGRTVGGKLRVPVISSFVNEPYAPMRYQSLQPLARLKLRGIQVLDALTARWACHFVANSEAVKRANARALGIPRKKVSVIYRGRDPAPLAAVSPSQVKRVQASLRLEPGVPVLLNVARLLDRKGQGDLVRAMPAILQRFPSAMLLIAGEGGYRTCLETLICELGLEGKVRLLGHRDDVPALLRVADVFAFPSHYEGFPGALIEAMMAGCPVVASDIPVHREAIESGETGLLVAVQRPEAIAQGIIETLSRPAEARRRGGQAHKVGVERFHVKRIAAQHEALYETVPRQ